MVITHLTRTLGKCPSPEKYYPSKRANADRWFIGGSFIQKIELSRDPNYAKVFQEKFGFAPKENKYIDSGLGTSLGFKRVYRNRLIVELGMICEVSLTKLFKSGNEQSFDLSSYVQLKIGYRFAAPTKVEEKG